MTKLFLIHDISFVASEIQFLVVIKMLDILFLCL